MRPERHNPSSIATLRQRQARVLVVTLPSCPWCGNRRGYRHFMTQ